MANKDKKETKREMKIKRKYLRVLGKMEPKNKFAKKQKESFFPPHNRFNSRKYKLRILKKVLRGAFIQAS